MEAYLLLLMLEEDKLIECKSWLKSLFDANASWDMFFHVFKRHNIDITPEFSDRWDEKYWYKTSPISPGSIDKTFEDFYQWLKVNL